MGMRSGHIPLAKSISLHWADPVDRIGYGLVSDVSV